ncbi:hypothetical protein [Actinomadura oligospora]|uniref:hypothetical protein n=1 Tax=Actinomadura oligospora TaxID=111804 RepID=UPI00047B1E53|nr:hypothetical protein [Actinomadura oligospora]
MTTKATDAGTETEPTQETTPAPTPSIEELLAERDAFRADAEKYKTLMRQEEGKRKSALKELDQLKRASMSEDERTIAEAVARGREAAAAEFEAERKALKLSKAAAEAGVDEEVLGLLDPTKVMRDGEVDVELLKRLAPGPAPRFAATSTDLGIGAQSTSGGQLTRADLRRMTRDQINKARDEGRLDDVMRGKA